MHFIKMILLRGQAYLCEMYYENLDDFRLYHKECVSIYIRPRELKMTSEGIASRGAKNSEVSIRESKLLEETIKLRCCTKKESLIMHL